MGRLMLAATVAAIAALITPSIGHASAEVVVAGSAVTTSGACLTLAGTLSTTANRSRWVGGYWERVTTPGPVCSDTDPHFDPVVTCAEAATIGQPGSVDHATVLSIQATGPARSIWHFKIVDRPLGADEFGAGTGLASIGPCGAGAVTTTPVTSGGFMVIAAS